MVERTCRALADGTLAADEFEVVVVGDTTDEELKKSSDTFKRLNEAGFNFRWFLLDHCGRAKANNFGVAQTRGEIILFLAGDFLASTSVLQAHLRLHDEHRAEQVVGIGAGLFPPQLRHDPFRRWLEDSGELFGVRFTGGPAAIHNRFFYVANASLKRTFLNKVGLFDEQYPCPAWDDWQMGLRLLAQGMQSVFLVEAAAIHDHAVTLPERRQSMRQAGGAAVIFERHHEGAYPWRAKCRVSPARHKLNALRQRLLFYLTRRQCHQESFYRAQLDSAFVGGYRQQRAADERRSQRTRTV